MQTACLRCLAIHFPVWRELKLWFWLRLRLLWLACYTLSRLKGIETCVVTIVNGVDVVILAIHFPVWRELKHSVTVSWSETTVACYTLSRLKGIETQAWAQPYCRALQRLAIHFPVWRELKQESIYRGEQMVTSSCYTLSRLKGIETESLPAAGRQGTLPLLYTFPFEGNWNKEIKKKEKIATIACYTLSRLKGIETLGSSNFSGSGSSSCYTLSRLKGIETSIALQLQQSDDPCYTLSRLKGIETRYGSLQSPRSERTCYTLSRLKGIETLEMFSVVVCRVYLLYTFPFEGNWNFGWPGQ